jgi:hypothetical protein
VIIRPIRADDRERWEPLWHGYLDFYRAVLPPEVTERTWAALCDPTSRCTDSSPNRKIS